MLFNLRDRLRPSGKTTFSRGELSLILGVYGAGVKSGKWRDYAIDSLNDMAVFSVYRATREQPAYRIAKMQSRGKSAAKFSVCEGDATIREGASLSEVLSIFTETP